MSEKKIQTHPQFENRRKDGKFRPGQSGNPKGRPKGARNKAGTMIRKSLNRYLEQAMEREVDVILESGEVLQVNPMQMIVQQMTQALVTGKLYLKDNQFLKLRQQDWLALLQLVFKQIAPPEQIVDLTIQNFEQMTDEEILSAYYQLQEEGDDFLGDDGMNDDETAEPGFGWDDEQEPEVWADDERDDQEEADE